MAPTKTIKSEDVSIVSAIETLSSIADLELTSALQDPLLIIPPPREAPVMVRTVRWLHQKNAERMQSIMREKLRIVFSYLNHFYESERERFARKESIEGIRTIMMLVDEASENLDRYTKLFLGTQGKSVKESKEFLDLCTFYETKIAPIAVHRDVSKWISALPIAEILAQAGVAQPGWTRKIAYAPLSVELEDIQRDIDYELLLIRKADGTRFFTPKFIRSMRLACDIERAVDLQGRAQVEVQIEALRRMQVGTIVNYLLSNCYPALDSFFHAAHRAKDHPLVLELYSPCIALMVAALQTIHRSESPRAKGIVEYFDDFRALLSQLVHSSEFKRLLTYPPANEHSWEYVLLRLAESFASTIVDGAPFSIDFVSAFKGLLNQGMSQAIEEQGPPDETLSHMLNLSFAALRQLIGSRVNKTLTRMLRELDTKTKFSFDPLADQAVPTHLYNFSWRGELIPIVRLPSPTRQERINEAFPSELLQIALRRHGRKAGRFLLINLQDRTGWKDGARCQAIEELQRKDDENTMLSVFSLCCDGEFYQQEGVYEEKSSAKEFKRELLEHMTEPNCGILFPRTTQMSIGREIEELIEQLHKSLYGGRNVLTQEQRIEFIDLLHVLLLLRVIEETRPDMIFISCKDGLDSTLPAISNLFCFLKLFNQRPSSGEEKDWLAAVLLGIPLIERDRLLFASRYNRMTSLVRFLEIETQEEGGLLDTAAKDAVLKFLPQEIAFAAMIPASGHQTTYFERRYSM
jgi:hypothetical protein